MANVNKSIVFSTELDNKDLEKELAKLKNKIEALEKSLSLNETQKAPLVEQFESLTAQLDNAKANLFEMQNSSTTSTGAIDKQKETVRVLQAQWDNIARQIEKYDTNISKANAELTQSKEEAGKLATQLDEASINSGKLVPELDKAGDSIKAFEKRVIGLAKRVFVFSAITTALRSMRTWFGNVLKSNNDASASIAKLKGALLTLAQPVVEVVIPAFITLVNILTKVISVVASLVSTLFGKTLSSSKNAAENLYEETNAIEGVGGAAEDASKSLAGFDEINKLSSTSSAGGGASASTEKIAPDFDFEEYGGIVDILEDILPWVTAIGAAFLAWKISSGLTDTMSTALGLAMALGGAVIFAEGFIDAWNNGVDWENLAQMIAGVTLAATGLGIAFGPVAAGIALVVGGIGMLVVGFKDAIDNGFNLQNTLLIIAGILATGLGFFFITGSVIPLVIAGIASLLLALTVATGHGEELIGGIRTILEGFVDFFKGVFTGDIEKATEGINKIFEGFKTVVGSVIDGVRDSFLAFLDWLDEKTNGKLHGIIEAIKTLFSSMCDNAKTSLNNLLDAIKQVLNGITEFILGVFTADWERAWEGIKDIGKGAWNMLIAAIEGGINALITGVNWLIKQLNKISFEVPDWVPSIGGESYGINIKTLETIALPRLATGAVIPPNREFMAVLGDQKNGYNIEAPEALIRKIVREESGNNRNSNGGNMTVILEVDGQQFGKLVYKYNNAESQRVGVSLVGI